jgi:hypothetical protein
MEEGAQSGGVRIGNVEGGIHNSTIAGRDATVSLAGRERSIEEQPSAAELRQLLLEIQKELAEVMSSQGAGLRQVAPAVPSAQVKPESAKPVQDRLTEATSVLSKILKETTAVAEKADEAGTAVQPLLDGLIPLVKKIGVGALWAARLWM